MVDNNPALELLYLSYNDISSIPIGLVDNNPALIYLDWGDNDIDSIQVEIFNNNPGYSVPCWESASVLGHEYLGSRERDFVDLYLVH